MQTIGNLLSTVQHHDALGLRLYTSRLTLTEFFLATFPGIWTGPITLVEVGNLVTLATFTVALSKDQRRLKSYVSAVAKGVKSQ
jgi:hypothetical protein